MKNIWNKFFQESHFQEQDCLNTQHFCKNEGKSQLMCTATVGCLRLTMINYGQCFSFSFIAWFLISSVYGVFFKYRNRYDYKNNLNYTNSKNEFQINAMCYFNDSGRWIE